MTDDKFLEKSIGKFTKKDLKESMTLMKEYRDEILENLSEEEEDALISALQGEEVRNSMATMLDGYGNQITELMKNKKLMKYQYGCRFCAFYYHTDISEDELIDFVLKEFTGGVSMKDLNHLSELEKASADAFLDATKTYVNDNINEIKKELPSLCLMKNKMDPKPCNQYSVRVIGQKIKDRLNYHNTKISRRYSSLGVLFSFTFSFIAIIISFLT